MKHKLLAVGAALTLALCTATPALAAIEVDVNKAVIDNANILSQETEDYITGVSVSLQESCGAQIGVYTVDYIGNYTAEGYSYELFNAWGLGDADKDNGVLLLLIPGEDNYYVSRGAGIESQLPISTLSTILDEQLLDDWEAGNYDSGTQKTVAALADKLCRIYGVSLDQSSVGSTAAPRQEKGGLGLMGTLLVLIAVILVVAALVSLFRPRRPPRGPYDAPPPPRSSVGSNLFWYGVGRASRPRRSPPPPPPPRRSAPPPPPRPPRSGGSFPSGGGSRPGGVGRSGGSRPSGGSFRSGGGSSRGGGVGRR